MEEVSFQDWPGQPVDLNNTGTNPWMPAYGLQPPISALLDKEDFAGNPDAEYFFHGTSGQFMYLETIQEETSDDLRSDSGSRTSPVGWLATDSESGSVICIQDDADCDSDRELACPPKRRKQDLFLSFASEEYEEPTSLSRSSSLLQFETLEKQFQQESQSPSIFSQFSFDSLELGKKEYCLEDSSPEYEGDFFKNVVNSKQSSSRDSLLYNASTRYSGSESSDSDTIFDTSRSCDNLKTWRSFDSLPLTNGHCSAGKRFSSENLSEDSGYGDQMLYGKAGNLSNSAGNLADKRKNMTGRIGDMVKSRGKKNSYVGFNAYDCDVFQNFHGNFGVSYQDLSIFERYDPFSEPLSKSSPLTDVFLRRKQARQLLNADFTLTDHRPVTNSSKVNLDIVSAVSPCSNYNIDTVVHASSAPNLCQNELTKLEPVVDIFSVPKDLNFLGSINRRRLSTKSVAENNWNLADIWEKDVKDSELSSDRIKVSEDSNIPEEDMANYRREGSYSEAMRNRVDLSDDENSLVFKKKLPKSPIVDFDRRVLKAISEQSLQSLMGSTISLRGSQARLDKEEYAPTAKLGNYNVAKSTPDLNRFEPARKRDKTALFEDRERGRSNLDIRTTSRLEEERNKNILLDTSNDETEVVMRRKGSIIKSSTSTSGMSDIDDKTLRNSVKSFTGSTGSKGVTFAPVVAEVNWGDDASVSTATPDRESSYSLDSSSPEPVRSPPPQKLVKPRARYPRPQSRRSVSQPDLSDTDGVMYKREFIDHLNKFRDDDVEMSKSQPDMSKLKRRGSQMVKKDKDGCTIKAYVDADGIQYKHTQLDLKTLSQNSLNDDNSTDNTAKLLNSSGAADSKNSLLQSSSSSGKHPYHHHYYGHEPRPAATAQHQQQTNVERQRQSNVAKQPNVVGRMDGEGDAVPRSSTRDAKSSTKNNRSGLGGFLQRLASFRLGVKKGQEKVKRKAQTQGTTAVHSRPITNQNTTKPEYIYIPLKGPENNNVPTNQAPLMAKPPLPKQPPPRVVHASVKKHPSQGAQAQDYGATGDDRRRRRTIDSGSVATSGGDLGRRTRGNASMEGPMGLIETDLDTEVTVITSGANAKARSLLDLGQEPRLQVPQKAEGQQGHSGRPHKSMEFLLDKQNLKVVEPPENELQKTERVMSEHELRVQRSLQKLTIPDWYKHSQVPGQGFLLNKKNASRDTRWTGTGTGSKTTSLSSLGSGTQSPIVLSPTPCNQPFVRWSTSKLNSTASSPCQSTRSSFNQGRQPVNGSISPSSSRSSFSYRQPYMGWRSQERLNRPRTPAERLASSLLAQQVHNTTQENPEIQTSIKEVTSAIVHYVSGMKPPGPDHMDNHSQRSSSVSPRGSSQKLCWLESSFVGTKPLDSPETPVTCSESPVPPPGLRLDLQNYSSNDLATLSGGDTKVRPSPSSTTLEDVLDSLLGLPSSGRAPSPCLQETVSASTSPQRRLSISDDATNGAYRRRSEGSEPAASAVAAAGSALPSSAPSLLRCRYSRCGKTALAASKEAEQFKSCHNCSYTYCSRACRRSHWERHRKTCLFSRMGTLCRQVIASTKEKKDVLKELSVVAKRGYISHGLGAVKCFYPNPEAAERFLGEGLPSLGELTFVRWQDLLPSEMGPMLYEELVTMCKNYNPETKFVLYVSICVVSETPASGAVKWERQLVSRCAKIKLSKDLNFAGPDREIPDTPETLILTCNPIRLPTKETTMRARLIAFDNLQMQLRSRGVSLKRQYPDIYRRLDAYCEDLALKVEAQTIYPRQPGTNKSFMCIIMLESDSETLRHVEKAGVKVKTIDVLLCSETTAL